MRSFLKFRLVLGVVGVVLGFFISGVGLARLGLMRHRAHFFDFQFHLDWIFQPTLTQWASHMQNIGIFMTGLVLMGVGVYFLFRLPPAHRSY